MDEQVLSSQPRYIHIQTFLMIMISYGYLRLWFVIWAPGDELNAIFLLLHQGIFSLTFALQYIGSVSMSILIVNMNPIRPA
jgi:hypothetical protein